MGFDLGLRRQPKSKSRRPRSKIDARKSDQQSTDLTNHFAGVGIAGSAPRCEFDRVDAAVADLGPVDHRVVHFEPFGEVPLS